MDNLRRKVRVEVIQQIGEFEEPVVIGSHDLVDLLVKNVVVTVNSDNHNECVVSVFVKDEWPMKLSRTKPFSS